MYRTCLSCTTNLGTNEILEDLPVGQRVAFDSDLGRLWVICERCAKWNLVPFEKRLEVIDACERLFRATPTRYATDVIGLARVRGGLTLIRVGKAPAQEFAAWRYGEAFRRRRKRSTVIGAAIGLPIAVLISANDFGQAGSATSIVQFIMSVAGATAVGIGGLAFGPRILQARRSMIATSDPVTQRRITLRSKSINQAVLVTSAQVQGLSVPFDVGYDARDLFFPGREGEILAGRILGKLNAAAGSDTEIRTAVVAAATLAHKAEHASLYDSIAGLQKSGRHSASTLSMHEPAIRLALEMHANEADERRYLTGELQLLERQWREAELLAGIADGLAMASLEEPSSQGTP